ncbi:MAG: SpoIIE family protein phosphatase [Raineya sp.]|jgi:serine phosphatase RsbU (regulator of sigma subunit)|nr:SpoIIE family protein phosphatase [Raineya sp.]
MEDLKGVLNINLEQEWEKEYKRLGEMYAFWGAVMVIIFYPTAIFPELKLAKNNETLWYIFRAMPSVVVGITLLLYRKLKFKHEIVFEVIALAIFTAGSYRANCEDWIAHLINYIILFMTSAVLTVLKPYYYIINFVGVIILNVTFYMIFCQKSFYSFWTQRDSALFIVSGMASFAMAIFRYRILKNNFQQRFALRQAMNELSFKNTQLLDAQDELQNKNEEITIQNEQLKHQKEEILAQRDEIELQKNEIERKNRNIISSINYAKRIQEAVLPHHDDLKQIFKEYFVLYQPRDIVSGDFFWAIREENYVIFAVADCTGHGVPGAFMTMLGSNMLNNIVLAKNITKPSEILYELDREVLYMLKQDTSGSQDGMDITLCYIDLVNRKMQMASAHNPLVYIQDENIHIIKGSIHGIGGNFENSKVFENHEIDLSLTTTFYMFSDGFQDQFGGERNKKFSSKKLYQLLYNNHLLPMTEQYKILHQEITDWMGSNRESQIDDITVVGVRI